MSETDELGLLDYLGLFQTGTDTLGELIGSITDKTKDITQRMSQSTKEINALSGQAGTSSGYSRLTKTVNKIALEVLDYAKAVEVVLPQFNQTLSACAHSASQCVIIYMTDLKLYAQQQEEIKQMLAELHKELGDAVESTTEFRDAVVEWPRVTAVLNRAKQRAAAVLQQLINSLSSARNTLAETPQSFEDKK